MEDRKFINLKEVMEITGTARATIYKRIKLGIFPEQIPIGGRSVRWLESDISEWMDKQIDRVK